MKKQAAKRTKREAGKRLNKQGRLAPLEVFQRRMEYYDKLAQDEIALGELGSREKIGEYLKLAQEAAEAQAPYRHARLQAAELNINTVTKVIRAPAQSASNDEWLHKYGGAVENSVNGTAEFLERINRLQDKKLN